MPIKQNREYRSMNDSFGQTITNTPKYKSAAVIHALVSGVGNYSVYQHTFPNGKIYIGITSNYLDERWRRGAGYNSQNLMGRAIKKYGWDSINHLLVCEGLSKVDAETVERLMIASFKANERQYGYNIDNGGNVIGSRSIETRRKISEGHKGKPHWWSYKLVGGKRSEETKAKMSENHSDITGEKNPNYGRIHTEEERKRISENRVYTRGIDHPSAKRVIQKTFDGSVVKIWGSCSEAINGFRETPASTIKACCQKRTLTAYGFKWEYSSGIQGRPEKVAFLMQEGSRHGQTI